MRRVSLTPGRTSMLEFVRLLNVNAGACWDGGGQDLLLKVS